MFKERLKFVGMCFGLVALLVLSTSIIAYADYKLHFAEHIVAALRSPLAPYVVFTTFGLIVLWQIGRFIYWLFIQPFRKRKKGSA